jgi:hypothetical protein
MNSQEAEETTKRNYNEELEKRAAEFGVNGNN